MKQIILVLCVMLSAAAVNAQAKKTTAGVKKAGTAAVAPVVFKSAADSFSYAVGVNIGNNLKAQNVEKVNTALLQKGIDDVLKKKPLPLNEQQCAMVIQQTLQGGASKKATAEKAKSIAFLAENKKRKEVISLPNGLQYEVLKSGDQTSPMPKAEDTVVAHYAGTLIDGKEFDNSYKRGEPITIPVMGVIRGWTEILQMMHKGDKWKVYIPSELGYGDNGAGAGIPGGSALIFEMELVDIKPAAIADEKK